MLNLKIKPNYIIIPLITVFVAVAGGYFTTLGMEWYDATLIQPEITPPKWLFPIAWNLIFILTTISALIVWNKGKKIETKFLFIKKEKKAKRYSLIIELFIANAILNIAWSLLFFTLKFITIALFEIILLETTLVLLITFIWKISKTASILLLPYAGWVLLATYLNYQIVILN